MKIFYKNFVIFIILALFGFFVLSIPVLALDVGTAEVGEVIELSDDDPRIIIARIINIAMSLLGIIAVSIIVYAGFLWMSSGGQEEKISFAKKTLSNAIIGLVIVLSSWGIASFILNRIMSATGLSVITDQSDGGSTTLGTGVLGNCIVNSVFPEVGEKNASRNTSIMITFKEAINPATICDDANGDGVCSGENILLDNRILIYETNQGTDNFIADIKVTSTEDRKTFVLVPDKYLGNSSDSVWYTAYFSNDIEKADGENVFNDCSRDYLEWRFRVSNLLDLTPPQVLINGVFPSPDDEVDIVSETSPWTQATGTVTVKGVPNIFASATIASISKNPPSPSPWNDITAVIDPSFRSSMTSFNVSIVGENNAQLYSNNQPLGIADYTDDAFYFEDFFTISISGDGQYSIGNSWNVDVNSRQDADTITIGSIVYSFVDVVSSPEFQILAVSNLSEQASNIASTVTNHSDITASAVSEVVNITASVAGVGGNDILLSSSNPSDLEVVTISGGVDGEEQVSVNGMRDRPMNSIIQINFDEAINPISVSGNSDLVSPYVRVVNNSVSALGSGAVCTDDNECLSYDCDGTCNGNYLSGKFVVSNVYKTVEFISDTECGINSCGDKLYCLPPSSNLAVQLVAANLFNCASDEDCLNKTPYSACSSADLSYNTCRDGTNNYPLANISALDGIMDTSLNSLDSNRSGYAEGPISYYDENLDNVDDGDNYKWSFFINDKTESTSPVITSIYPDLDASNVDLGEPMSFEFNRLIMSSTLRTGDVDIQSGDDITNHKYVNLTSISGTPVGFWITRENIDKSSPLNGEADVTKVYIRHSTLNDSATYIPQVGSGVKDIYQNCFKPSGGPNCSVTDTNPSCCFGTATDQLDEDGNCLN